MGKEFINLPPQQLPFTKKTRAWRKQCVDWADNKSFSNYSLVRKSVIHKKINYDLLNGILHMQDLEMILNPESVIAGYVPDKIQHYPIMNSKLNVLRGEELARIFDYRVVVTNPNAISEIEENKKQFDTRIKWRKLQTLNGFYTIVGNSMVFEYNEITNTPMFRNYLHLNRPVNIK